jgi:hypothetical protein
VISKLTYALSFVLFFCFFDAQGQLNKLYQDSDEENELRKICFYTKSEGYIAFKNFIAFTADGGKTFVKKQITNTNVDFNGNAVNLTFGFAITGVKAFDKNTLIVYGDYGLVPAILYSTDQGNTFKVVFHSQISNITFSYIVDLVFPENGNIGYAIDEWRLLKTTDRGLTWKLVDYYGPDLKRIVAPSNENIYVLGNTGIVKSANGGPTWNGTNLPGSGANRRVIDAFFLTPSKGWVYVEANGVKNLYYTSDGAASYSLRSIATPGTLNFQRISFVNDNIGYALGPDYTTYKTSDGGKYWEVLKRDNNFSYLSYSHTDLQIWDENLLWVGGHYGFFESSTNGGGKPVPGVDFLIDKSAFAAENTIKLINYSKPGYQYKWSKNGIVFATDYNTSFKRDLNRLADTIELTVSDGTITSRAEKYVSYPAPLTISSFQPKRAGQGMDVTIYGTNFASIESVTFGGVPAIIKSGSSTKMIVTLGKGGAGEVVIKSTQMMATSNDFEYVPPPADNAPLVLAITPDSGVVDEFVTIIGYNFNEGEVKIGNVTARIENREHTKILAYAGEGTNRTVSVTTPAGTSSIDGFTFITPAAITSFSPEKAEAGAKLTIFGRNFNPSISKTKVQFGTISARVLSVTSTAIEVLVPQSAPYKEIAVISDGRTAYTAKPFNLLFPGGGGISASSFNKAMEFTLEGQATSVITADVDGDKKSDLVVTYHDDNGYHCQIFRNTSTDQQIQFNKGYAIAYVTVSLVADLDADGLPEIVTAAGRVFKNKSLQGTISFITDYATNSTATTSFADLDGDGKTDLLSKTGIQKNVKTADGLKFRGVTIPNTANNTSGDLNGDGKPDLVISKSINGGGADIYISKSRVGVISYEKPIQVRINGSVTFRIADIDGDGKEDIIALDSYSKQLTILRNKGENGTVSFDEPVIYLAPRWSYHFDIADIDGDGKPDIVSDSESSVCLWKNLSEPQNLKFALPVFLAGAGTRGNIALADFDGDGKMEVVVPQTDTKLVTIHKNATKPDPVIYDFSPAIGFAGDRIVITGTNFSQTTSVSFGGTSASFRVDSPTQLTATLVAGATGDVVVTNITGTSTIPGFLYGRIPVISSISSISADAATTLIITGNHFSPVAASNLVQFGLTRATVLSATSEQLKVTVPPSATLGRVSVMVNGLTGWSKEEFSLSFPYDYTGFTKKSFTNEVDVPIRHGFGHIIDLDGDGKMDLVTMWENNPQIVISKNTSQDGILSFGPNKTYDETQGNGDYGDITKALSVSDIDGDGKQDIITYEYNLNGYITVLRNTSTGGEVSLAKKIRIASAMDNYVGRIKVFDIDMDGRNDLIAASVDQKRISIFLNKTISSNIVFANPIYINLDQGIIDVEIGDINNDGLLDLVAATNNASALFIFLNQTRNGKASFTKGKSLTVLEQPQNLKLTDFDNDGNLDIIYFSADQNFIILRNRGIVSDPAFDEKIAFNLPGFSGDICTSDLDGDGKKDIAVQGFMSFNIYKNLTSGPEIKFGDKAGYLLRDGGTNEGFSAADFDGDGLPDLVRFSGYYTSVLLRNPAAVKPRITAISEKEAYAGMTIVISGFELQDATSVTFGGVPVKSFHVYNPNSIYAVLGDGASGEVEVTTPLGVAKFPGLIFRVQPTITSFTPTFGKEGTEVTIKGTHLGDINKVYIGSISAKSFVIVSDTEIKAIAGNGTSGGIEVRSPKERANSGLSFTFLIDPKVFIISPPVIYGGNEVAIHVDENTGSGLGFNYGWERDGIVIPGASGMSFSATQPGTYRAFYIHEGNTQRSNPIVIKEAFNLPATNFKIKSTAVSCKGGTTGAISIEAVQELSYIATISRTGIPDKAVSFTKTTSITGLTAGNYMLCITVNGRPDYKQCFEAAISEPQDIKMYAVVNPDQTVTLTMEGANLYHVKLNGKEYSTSDNTITLPVNQGSNSISVSSDLPCQTAINKEIQGLENLKVTPNPFESELTVQTSFGAGENVRTEVYDMIGRRVYSNIHKNDAGEIQLNLGTLPSGMYVLRLFSGTNMIQSKIVKK